MRIIYALFNKIENARLAVSKLVDEGFSEDQMNAVVQQVTAKLYLNISDHQISSLKSSRIGKPQIRGLESLLGGVQPVTLSDIGTIYASGTEATTLVKAAVSQNDGAFYGALQNFQIPPELASDYQKGVLAGALLFWIRTTSQNLYKAQETLEQFQAEKLLTIPF